MRSFGGYPGKLLVVDETGVWFSECYGAMSTESGGQVSTLEAFESLDHAWIRDTFGEDAVRGAIDEVRSLLEKKRG